ncbi:MAG: cupin domain-containing protein [Planctomycetota bacterium]|nr:cupin domain-containing protein [Planctomycetota bacterium]
MSAGDELIARLQLAPHPEGGWYRETHRSALRLPADALPGYPSGRAALTSIFYLLQAGECSVRHRLRTEELWLHQGGDVLRMQMESPEGDVREELRLGTGADAELQAVVPAGWWQSAEPEAGEHGYVLVACVMAPGFEFEDFEV